MPMGLLYQYQYSEVCYASTNTWVILYLTGLNYYGHLKPFFSPYIDVYVFAMRFYITSSTKKSDLIFYLCFRAI